MEFLDGSDDVVTVPDKYLNLFDILANHMKNQE